MLSGEDMCNGGPRQVVFGNSALPLALKKNEFRVRSLCFRLLLWAFPIHSQIMKEAQTCLYYIPVVLVSVECYQTAS